MNAPLSASNSQNALVKLDRESLLDEITLGKPNLLVNLKSILIHAKDIDTSIEILVNYEIIRLPVLASLVRNQC